MTVLMNIDCIFTFDKLDKFGGTQSFGDLDVEIEKADTCWISLLNEKFFPKLAAYCADMDRDVKDLNKLSTSANWKIYSGCTGVDGLVGHSGKWLYGHGHNDLDKWELELTNKHNFGKNVDWSWMYASDPMQALIEKHRKMAA